MHLRNNEEPQQWKQNLFTLNKRKATIEQKNCLMYSICHSKCNFPLWQHSLPNEMESFSDVLCLFLFQQTLSPPETLEHIDITRGSVQTLTFEPDRSKGIQRLNSSCCFDNLIFALFGCINNFLDEIPQQVENDSVMRQLLSITHDLRRESHVSYQKTFDLRKELLQRNERLHRNDAVHPRHYLKALFAELNLTPLIELK